MKKNQTDAGTDQDSMVHTVNGRVDKKFQTQSASKNSFQDVPTRNSETTNGCKISSQNIDNWVNGTGVSTKQTIQICGIQEKNN